MALTFQLVDNTPYVLRYLVTQDGTISTPPITGDSTATLGNSGAATPDMRTDLATDPAGPLRRVVRAHVDGVGAVIAAGAVLTQAQARALMNSDDNAATTLTNNYVPRATTILSPRTGQPGITWRSDINVDAAGNPVVQVQSSVGNPATAYLHIFERHSYNL